MSNGFQFIGTITTEWLTPAECRAQGSNVQLWRITSPFSVVLPDKRVVTVPRDFVTDFGSVPGWAQSYVGTENPPLNIPALIHDYGYSTRGVMFENSLKTDREGVDGLFRQLLLACGMRSSQAWVVYHAVRLGGGAHWKS